MIDTTVPEAIRYISDPAVTEEFKCPNCGGVIHHRSWDKTRQTFCYHCLYCGHDSKITWAATAVLRAKGEVKFDENGAPIIPDDVTIPPMSGNPNNSALEVWEIMNPSIVVSGQSISGNDDDDINWG